MAIHSVLFFLLLVPFVDPTGIYSRFDWKFFVFRSFVFPFFFSLCFVHTMVLLSLSHITQQLKSTLLCKAHAPSIVAVKKQKLTKSTQHIDLNQPVVLYPRRIDGDKIAADIVPNINTRAKTEIAPATSGLSMPVTPHYVPPRAPIVLCHGLYGFDKLGPDALPLLQVQYWGGIENELAKLGAKVIVTKVPSTGSIWDRAHTLHSILKSILDGRDVNFVAHSMVIVSADACLEQSIDLCFFFRVAWIADI